jgi:hypothetical protein
MKHEAINIDDPESFKESVLDTIEWTRDSIRQEFRKVLNDTLVTEDAGTIVPMFIQAYLTSDAVVAWTEIPVTSYAEPVYKPRLEAAARILALKFHVEQSQREGDRDEITIHRISIRHEYRRSV